MYMVLSVILILFFEFDFLVNFVSMIRRISGGFCLCICLVDFVSMIRRFLINFVYVYVRWILSLEQA